MVTSERPVFEADGVSRSTCIHCENPIWMHEVGCKKCQTAMPDWKNPQCTEHPLGGGVVIFCPKPGEPLRELPGFRAMLEPSRHPRPDSPYPPYAPASPPSGPIPEPLPVARHPLIWKILDGIEQAREWTISQASSVKFAALRLRSRAWRLRDRVRRIIEISDEPKPEVTFSSFAFLHAQDSGKDPGTWCCPNCGGHGFGSDSVERLYSNGVTYYCTGVGQMQGEGCGYWETPYSPRSQGLGEPMTPERW